MEDRDDLGADIERLRKSRRDVFQKERARALSVGRHWARKFASFEVLQRVAEINSGDLCMREEGEAREIVEEALSGVREQDRFVLDDDPI